MEGSAWRWPLQLWWMPVGRNRVLEHVVGWTRHIGNMCVMHSACLFALCKVVQGEDALLWGRGDVARHGRHHGCRIALLLLLLLPLSEARRSTRLMSEGVVGGFYQAMYAACRAQRSCC